MDKENLMLVALYWKLQRQVHLQPGLRGTLFALRDLIRERQVTARDVNAVGLAMVESGELDNT